MIALDTSVVVATFAPWHEHHARARRVLAAAPRLVAHTALEAYSVLTRLPEPFRVDPAIAVEFLERTFRSERLALDPDAHACAPRTLSEAGVGGGATYDGVIALAAREAGAQVVTLDRRALDTYARCGADARLLV
ncbi:MAG: PIN domain-containing protein [Thermoleophilaceae bacterium]|nr:PIN domain-containing protein [Thermoleophilaceae bacterium]